MEIRWWHKSFEDPKPLIRVPKSRHFKPSPNFNSSYQTIKHAEDGAWDRAERGCKMESGTEGESLGRELWMERHGSEGDKRMRCPNPATSSFFFIFNK